MFVRCPPTGNVLTGFELVLSVADGCLETVGLQRTENNIRRGSYLDDCSCGMLPMDALHGTVQNCAFDPYMPRTFSCGACAPRLLQWACAHRCPQVASIFLVIILAVVYMHFSSKPSARRRTDKRH
jgi:hypothetical protein